MIQNFFINTIKIKKRNPSVAYEDWIMKESFVEVCQEVECRVSHLAYKDLALLQWIDDIQRTVRKLYTNPWVNISPKDFVEWEWKDYQVIAEYNPQDSKEIHHKKFFIKLVE
jgi:hypothetical protein